MTYRDIKRNNLIHNILKTQRNAHQEKLFFVAYFNNSLALACNIGTYLELGFTE